MIEVAYIALGSNVGDRQQHLAEAHRKLAQLPESRIVGESLVEETEAITVGEEKQEPYLNQIVALETSLSAARLLRELHAIEKAAGRKRTRRWEPRTLDLDIVLFGNQTIRTSSLTVPHPELPNRTFWKRELMQLGMPT